MAGAEPYYVNSEESNGFKPDFASIPEGVWEKCPSCQTVLYREDIIQNQYVCTNCGHHMRISARKTTKRPICHQAITILALASLAAGGSRCTRCGRRRNATLCVPAVDALANMAFNPECRPKIMEAGAIEPLVELLDVASALGLRGCQRLQLRIHIGVVRHMALESVLSAVRRLLRAKPAAVRLSWRCIRPHTQMPRTPETPLKPATSETQQTTPLCLRLARPRQADSPTT